MPFPPKKNPLFNTNNINRRKFLTSLGYSTIALSFSSCAQLNFIGNKEKLHRINKGCTKEMVFIKDTTFYMGSNEKYTHPSDGEGPARKVYVNPFYIDKYVVSNEKFSEFVKATHYLTEAERLGSSFVFWMLLSKKQMKEAYNNSNIVSGQEWWIKVNRACWDHPEGPKSTIKTRMNHPVVHISYNDALRYCKWAKKRLPTEAEWECAARGNLEQKRYAWGNQFKKNNQLMCNIWEGQFPLKNKKEDGFLVTAPVDSYEPNGFGLYNIAGNVWEWCYDWWDRNYHTNSSSKNPLGIKKNNLKVIKGGSYLCHASYCYRYRVGARASNTPNSSSCNLSFRCVRDV